MYIYYNFYLLKSKWTFLLLATEWKGKSTGSTLQCAQGCCGAEGSCGGGQGGGLPVQQELALPVISRGINETRVQQVLLALKLLSQDIILILFSPIVLNCQLTDMYIYWLYFFILSYHWVADGVTGKREFRISAFLLFLRPQAALADVV